MIFDGHSWYIKFRIDQDGDLEILSFHPPEKPLVTANGTVS